MKARSRIRSASDEAARMLASGEPWSGGMSKRADLQARQSSKIKELGDALVTAGFQTLDGQANALGLSRSTTWTVLRANHKHSGLSAAIINRMLRAPQLPPPVRVKIFEYIKEKATGLYGHNKLQRQRFAARLAVERVGQVRAILAAQRQLRERLNSAPRNIVPLGDEAIELASPEAPYRH